MKRTIAAAVGAISLAVLGPALAQTPPNVLVVGQIAEPQSLDPQHVSAVNDFRILVNVYEGLVQYADGTLEVEPLLATGWEISDDGMTYTFDLRDDVTFHDGSPFNAEAVVFNFERMIDEDHPNHTGTFPLSFYFSAIELVAAVDEYTVEFQLNEPYAPFLSNLAYPAGLIVSPAAVQEHGEDFDRNPSGTGPFAFVEWQSNTRVVVERNADYWDDAPALDAIVFRPITDANTRVAEMLGGGIDVMVEVPPDNVGQFAASADFTMLEQAGPHVWFLILNMREGPFTDVRVRQAVNYAVNKEAIVENVLQGTATVADSPIPPAFNWAYNDDLDPYPYDPDRARALLEDAGAIGAELTFYVTEGGSGMLDPIAIATAIQADLAAVGLTVNIETYEWNTFLGIVNPGLEGKADMAEMAWMTNDPDTLPFLALRSAAFPDLGGFNSGYYSNPVVDDLLEQARTSTDQDVRASLYREVQQIVYDDAPWLFVANWQQNAVTAANVSGLTLQPSFLLFLKDVVKN